MCLDSDQAYVSMEEFQEGICGTHQSAPKMKWSLRLFKESVLNVIFYYSFC